MFSLPFRFSICLLCTPSRSKIPPPPSPSILLYILYIRSFVREETCRKRSVKLPKCTYVLYSKNWRELYVSRKVLQKEFEGFDPWKIEEFEDSIMGRFYGNVLSLDNVDSCTSLKSMVSWAEVNAAKWCAIQLAKFFVFLINLLSSLESMDSSLMVFKGERMKFNIIQFLNYYKI